MDFVDILVVHWIYFPWTDGVNSIISVIFDWLADHLAGSDVFIKLRCLDEAGNVEI